MTLARAMDGFRDDAAALRRRLREVDPAPHRPAEVRRIYPGGIHWIAAHPYRFTFALIAALSIVLLVIE